MKQLKYFFEFPFFIQVLWLLCLLGALLNVALLWRDMTSGGILWHLHACFLLLYVTQIICIWLKEPLTAIITLLQGLIALISTSDFIFFPILKVMGMCWVGLFDPSVQTLKSYEYVFVSLAFTLQMMSAYYIFATLRRLRAEPVSE